MRRTRHARRAAGRPYSGGILANTTRSAPTLSYLVSVPTRCAHRAPGSRDSVYCRTFIAYTVVFVVAATHRIGVAETRKARCHCNVLIPRVGSAWSAGVNSAAVHPDTTVDAVVGVL